MPDCNDSQCEGEDNKCTVVSSSCPGQGRWFVDTFRVRKKIANVSQAVQ